MNSKLFNLFRPTIGVGIDFGTFKSMIAITNDPSEEPEPVQVSVDTARAGYLSKSIPTRAIVKLGKDQRLIKSLSIRELTSLTQVTEKIYAAKRFKLYVGYGWPKREAEILRNVLADQAGDLTVEQLSGLVFKHLLAGYELKKMHDKLGKVNDLHPVVISVPANWNYRQRRAVIQAAQIEASIPLVFLMEEPIAVAFYLLHSSDIRALVYPSNYLDKPRIDFAPDGSNILIIDIGAGTCDLALLKRQGNGFLVLDTDSDWIAGGDIDKEIIALFLKQNPSFQFIQEGDGYSILENNQPIHPIRYECIMEAVRSKKEDLNNQINPEYETVDDHSDDYFDTLQKGFHARGIDFSPTIDLNEFQTTVRRFFDEKFTTFLEDFICKDTNQGDFNLVTQVFLVGGTSKIFCFEEIVKSLLQKHEGIKADVIRIAKEPEYCVAKGTAIFSYYLNKRKNKIYHLAFAYNPLEIKAPEKVRIEASQASVAEGVIRFQKSREEPLKLAINDFIFLYPEEAMEKIDLILFYKPGKNEPMRRVDTFSIQPYVQERQHVLIPANSQVGIEYEIGTDQIIRFREPTLHHPGKEKIRLKITNNIFPS